MMGMPCQSAAGFPDGIRKGGADGVPLGACGVGDGIMVGVDASVGAGVAVKLAKLMAVGPGAKVSQAAKAVIRIERIVASLIVFTFSNDCILIHMETGKSFNGGHA